MAINTKYHNQAKATSLTQTVSMAGLATFFVHLQNLFFYSMQIVFTTAITVTFQFPQHLKTESLLELGLVESASGLTDHQ